MNIEELYQRYLSCKTVCTDTRKLERDCMYFGLKGENFDGNTFAEQAISEGAKYCVVDNANVAKSSNYIVVQNVLAALQELARYHRDQLTIPIIGLTGSNGKTTTKELINAVLSTTYKTKATVGNLNNHIGVPLTVLSISSDHEIGIIEMGANHKKEIEFLSNICKPDFGLITNFGKAHLEGFGGIEGVVKGKSELYNYLRSHHKVAVINTNDKQQIKQIGKYSNTYTFGSMPDNDCVVEFLEANPFVHLNYNDITIKTHLIGDYNFGNIAVAIALGQYFKLSTENIKKAIEAYQPDNNRSEIIKKKSNHIILDAYNANPTSMLAALKNFNQLNDSNKMLFIGDMFELGEDAKKEHQFIVDYIEGNFKTNVHLIGENFFNTRTQPSTKKFKSFEDLKLNLQQISINDSSLLIKGSRGMALERILDLI